MGTFSTKLDMCEDKKKLYEEKTNIIHTYDVVVDSSTVRYIKKNTLYKLHLCENDLVLENIENSNNSNNSNNSDITIMYQKINSWYYSKNIFGFNFIINNNINRLVFNVENSLEITNNIRDITQELVEYYKSI